MSGPPVPQPPLAAPETPVVRLEDWLRTDGRWIFYRYGAYLPGACRQPTRAVGNWGRDGRSEGDAVLCIDRAWLGVDVARLGRRFELSPQTTYCLNFVYVAGDTQWWGSTPRGPRRGWTPSASPPRTASPPSDSPLCAHPAGAASA